ncbi:MAG: ABC transporter substrate-binding protein [Euryarchaeota archaeon]|nr:ABC transporter substrate-binding protein [Euryarchaeota archaeon]
MRTNTILLGIAMCSLLLALPAAASDYTLGIFGNANEDETINMQDVTYTELIILEYRDKTELADAKHDGKINMQDVTQIELVILGKEKELTLVDSANRIVTVKKPIERIVEISFTTVEVMRSLKLEMDKLVGVSKHTKDKMTFFPEFSECPDVGESSSPNYEVILELQPDIVFLYALGHSTQMEEIRSTLSAADPTIAVVGFSFNKPSIFIEEVQKLGYVLGKRNEADEFIDFYNDWINAVKERIEEISESEKPKVYFELAYSPYKTCGEGYFGERVEMAGGNNIFSDLSGSCTVDPEEVIERNPEIIVVDTWAGSYDEDDISVLVDARDEFVNRPEMSGVDAVKNGHVYVLTHKDFYYGPSHFIAIAYMAKWFHSELLEDLGDPQAFHQEYLTRFQELDYNLDEHGVFVYPPHEES